MHKTCSINYGHLADLQKFATDLNKKNFHLIKYLLATFIFFLSFQSVLVFFRTRQAGLSNSFHVQQHWSYSVVATPKFTLATWHQLTKYRQPPHTQSPDALTHLSWTQPFPSRHFQMHFHESKFCILIRIPLKCVPEGPIDKIPALVQITAWRWSGDKPLSEPMLT